MSPEYATIPISHGNPDRSAHGDVIHPEVCLSGQDEDGPSGAKRHKTDDVVFKLRKVDVLVSQRQNLKNYLDRRAIKPRSLLARDGCR
jgi:hypothetical protein